MARPKKAAQSSAKTLQAALEFCSVAFRDVGPTAATHVVLANRWMFAFDAVTAAGCPIDDDLVAYPHGPRLQDALNRPGTGLGLALAADAAYLGVTLGGFRARVPCADLSTVQPYGPDVPTVAGSDALREAFGAVAHMAANSGTTVLESSLLLDAHTVTATNRVVVLQAWHGLALPFGPLVLPRAFATAVLKTAKPIVALGASEATFTVHFADHSWLRTQLFTDAWPDLEPVFAARSSYVVPVDLPAKFWEACEAVEPFVNGGNKLYVVGNFVSSDAKPDSAAAAQRVDGLSPTVLDPLPVMPARMMKHIAGRVGTVDWCSDPRAVHFFGDGVRAAVMRYSADA